MSKPIKHRFWIPLAIVLLATAWVASSFLQESTMRYAVLDMAIVAAVILLGIWWVFLAGKFRWRSLLAGIALLIALTVGAIITLRYDGSSHGANPLKLAWKWTPKPGESIEALPAAADGAPVIDPASTDPDLADFPGFLGEKFDGVVADPGLNPDWAANPPKELWRIPVGLGWSGFAVAGERAITQEQRGDEELVTCYHVKTGQFLWAHSDPVRFSEGMGGDGPRATPTIVGDVAYVVGATGVLNALSIENGYCLWSRPVLEHLGSGNVMWGVASSPLVTEKLVVVTAGDSASAAIAAFDRQTGEPVWKSGRGPASYATPRLLNLDGADQIVTVFGENVGGFNPETGEEIWSFNWPGTHPKVAQPIQVGPQQLLITASYGVPCHLLRIEGAKAESVWDSLDLKTKFSSAVVKDGFAYGLSEGRLACINLANGDRVWKGGKYGYGQNLLVGDGYILIQAENGDVALVKADPEEFVELGKISALTGKTWNPPALAGKYLLIRNDHEAVGLKLP